MMKRQMMTEVETLSMGSEMNVAFRVKNFLVSPVKAYGRIISNMMGVDFSLGETLRILNVQMALLCILLPVCSSLIYYALMTAWFVVAVYQCRELNKKVV